MKTRFTPEIDEKILKLIANGDSITRAAKALGIPPSTLKSRIQRARKAKNGKQAEFYQKYLQAIADSEKALLDWLHEGDVERRIIKDPIDPQNPNDKGIIRKIIEVQTKRTSDARWLLERRFPDEYAKPMGTEEFLAQFKERYGEALGDVLQDVLDTAEAMLKNQ